MAYQSNSAEEQDRSRRQQEETTNGAARLEQAQQVLEAAAGILDASSWEQPLPTTSSSASPNQQQEQQQHPSTMTAGSVAGARSSPIAIRRKEDKSDEFSSSDDDDEDEDLNLNRLNLDDANSDAKRRAAQSLPNRYLLRAPHLGSVPTRNADELLPAMSLSEQQDDTAGSSAGNFNNHPEDGTVSYGSLRDSQMKGRFLDGPRSFYRDRRTGKLRQRSDATRNVRFQMASSAPVPNAGAGSGGGLSIGERIQQSRKLQKGQNSTTTNGPGVAIASNGSSGSEKQQTSSLSAMLEGVSSSSSLIGGEPHNSSTAESPIIGRPPDNTCSNLNSIGGLGSSFLDIDDGDDDPSNMLSTSLTGLEILQRGLQKEAQQQKKSSANRSSFSTAQQQQGISLMSRSLSDTQPERRTTLQQSVFFPAAASTTATTASQLLIPPRNAAGTALDNSDPHAAGLLAPSGNGVASFLPPQFPSSEAAAGQQQQQLAPINSSDDDAISDHNADTEGAFDLDFE